MSEPNRFYILEFDNHVIRDRELRFNYRLLDESQAKHLCDLLNNLWGSVVATALEKANKKECCNG